jgi:ABC-type taurine transport system ATPase subunit
MDRAPHEAALGSEAMAKLCLESLEIQGYRLFDRLVIPRLGRVNLITGKNNTGKTTILEALRLYADRAAPETLVETLIGRDELGPVALVGEGSVTPLLDAFQNLYHGRPRPSEPKAAVRIGPCDPSGHQLVVYPGWYEADESTGQEQWLLPGLGAMDLSVKNVRPSVQVAFEGKSARFWFDEIPRHVRHALISPDLQQLGQVRCAYVGPGGLTSSECARLWDGVALTDLEGEVIRALQIIEPGVERLSLVGQAGSMLTTATIPTSGALANSVTGGTGNVVPSSGTGLGTRVFRVRVGGVRDPFPLKSMGDGINRILGITLALVAAQSGLLLLDEIENGIHYTKQEELWRHLFRLAAELDVQVFATTHSYDCVLAFQQAATEHPDEGVLVRLNERQGHVTATLFDEKDLSIVAAEEIEVR